jgi:hypothetical protein
VIAMPGNARLYCLSTNPPLLFKSDDEKLKYQQKVERKDVKGNLVDGQSRTDPL